MGGIDAVLRPAPIVLIVPPFHWITRPHLGVHLLQGIARRAGVECQVLYTNILFAAQIGEGSYESLATMSYGMHQGERLFARAAYGLPRLGRDGGANLASALVALKRMYRELGLAFDVDVGHFAQIEELVEGWVESIAVALAAGPQIVGCSSSFEQTAASIAILGALKRLSPNTTTILGGANCEGPMAAGVLGMAPDALDYVFSGESEDTFRAFVEAMRDGERPATRILEGLPCEKLDALPVPDYADYYEQLAMWLPRTRIQPKLTFETSRGCWWGEKKHCTFCGLNGQGMASREKSPERALAELATLLAAHPNRRVTVTDNIMPHSYWKSFVARLPDEQPGLEVMYEQKANLTLAQVRALARAGITEIQPGIEALSSGLLKLMDKGTTAAQNIALLRYAGACGMVVQWNILYGFPNDELGFYRETIELLPLIHHLPAPNRAGKIIIDRFSPYHTYPERYGIRDLAPLADFDDVLPPTADRDAVAYHFTATFASAIHEHPAVVGELERAIDAWRAAYHGSARPRLEVVMEPDPDGGESYALIDTRGVPGTLPRRALTRAQAVAALTPRRVSPAAQREVAWALEAAAMVVRDGRYVPLATAEPALFAELTTAAPSVELLQAL